MGEKGRERKREREREWKKRKEMNQHKGRGGVSMPGGGGVGTEKLFLHFFEIPRYKDVLIQIQCQKSTQTSHLTARTSQYECNIYGS